MGLPLCSWQAERRWKGHCGCWHWLLCGEGKLLVKGYAWWYLLLIRYWQSLDGATSFYKTKEEYVKQNLEKLQETINGKQSSLRGMIELYWIYGTKNGKCSLSFLYIAIVNVMQDKVQQQQAAAAKS